MFKKPLPLFEIFQVVRLKALSKLPDEKVPEIILTLFTVKIMLSAPVFETKVAVKYDVLSDDL